MLRIVRWLLGLATLAGLVWFTVAVRLGPKTLVEHARAIAGTREARALSDGTAEEAGKISDQVRRLVGAQQTAPAVEKSPAPAARRAPASHAARPARAAHADDEERPMEALDDGDRLGLDRLVRDKSPR
jgi:hypothetical protein